MKFYIEIRNSLRGVASYSMHIWELFKYSFIVKIAIITNHI